MLATGAPFYEPLVATDRDALSAALFDLGYDRARVVSTVTPVAGQPRRRHHLRRRAGHAGAGRPHPRRRQPPHRHRHDRAGADVEAGRPARPVRGLREPAQPARARPLPPRHHHRRRRGRRVAARSRHHRRGSGADLDRLRRRRRGRTLPAPGDPGRAGHREVRAGRARVLRGRPPEPLGIEPVGEPVHPRHPASIRRGRGRRRQRFRLQRVPCPPELP